MSLELLWSLGRPIAHHGCLWAYFGHHWVAHGCCLVLDSSPEIFGWSGNLKVIQSSPGWHSAQVVKTIESSCFHWFERLEAFQLATECYLGRLGFSSWMPRCLAACLESIQSNCALFFLCILDCSGLFWKLSNLLDRLLQTQTI